MSHWASLHEDLVMLVSRRVLAGDLLDYVRFQAVCTYWRSATVCPRGRGITDPRFHPRRWMMLPKGHGLHPNDDDKKRRFFNLSTGAFVRPRLPLFVNHLVICNVEGLLLLGKQDQEEELTICLLHPFTSDVAELPPLTKYRLDSWLCDGATVSLSVDMDGVATVMIAHLNLRHLLFATTKDKQWSVSPWSVRHIARPIAFQGKIYTIQLSVHPVAHQFLQIGPPFTRCEEGRSLISLTPPKAVATFLWTLHGPVDLAECDSEILVIVVQSKALLVYRLADLVLDKVVPVTNIGGNTIFLDIERRIIPRSYYHNGPDFGRSIR